MDASTDYYEISQEVALAEILEGPKTEIWGYNGMFPGPTIESRRGRRSVVTHTNNLPVPTVVHLHGGHTPAESDGYPLDLVFPIDRSYMNMHARTSAHDGSSADHLVAGDTSEGSRSYTYPLEQRAAQLWYHDHRMDFTGPSVWRGLAGFHIVRDEEEDALQLPSGDHELPLMITDRAFDSNNQLTYPSVDPSLLGTPGVRAEYVGGVLGDVMLVNGTAWPFLDVDRASYRLRILNACNARRLDIRLDPPDADLTQIGSDGGLLATPIRHQHFELASAQRVDLIVDFSKYKPGTRVTLVNAYGDGDMGKILQFRVGERSQPAYEIPDRLSSISPLVPANREPDRTMRFLAGNVNGSHGWVVNGLPFSPHTVSAAVSRGTVEVWRLISDFYHPVHLHLNPFQVISRGGGPPGVFDAGWKDTIDLRPYEEATIATRFDGSPGKYVFHCHNLEHEDMAMMANFTIS